MLLFFELDFMLTFIPGDIPLDKNYGLSFLFRVRRRMRLVPDPKGGPIKRPYVEVDVTSINRW